MSEELGAFVLRMVPGGKDCVKEGLATNELIMGWSNAKGLTEPSLSWPDFRERIQKEYFRNDVKLQRVGMAAGSIWRFIREIKPGDLIVVPNWSEFYVARVKGEARYVQEKIQEDSAYRRSVEWLNNKKPIPRRMARGALMSRMRAWHACADARDLVDEVMEVLAYAEKGDSPTFATDLRQKLSAGTLVELRQGRLDDYQCEGLVKGLLESMGAREARIVPRNKDKGADIVATFLVAGVFKITVAVQVRHWQPEPAVQPCHIDELIRGMEAESADLGLFITTGAFSEEAERHAEGKHVELVDGEMLAAMLLESGAFKAGN